MLVTINDNLQQLIGHLDERRSQLGSSPENTPEYAKFIAAFPANRLNTLTLDEYCVGKGMESFCWWVERGLQPVLGRYSPGSSKGHVIYFQKDGTVYKHRALAHLSDEDALRYTLKIQSIIANADIKEDISWLDDNDKIYQRAGVEPLTAVGVGRKLRLLSCYNPSDILPIQSSGHIKHFLLKFGCPEQDIPHYKFAIARSQLLNQYFMAARDAVPGLTPRDLMYALYNSPLGLAPEKEDDDDDSDDDEDRTSPASSDKKVSPMSDTPLNLILYGPPGTGKTYETVDAALSIADPTLVSRQSQGSGDAWSMQKEQRAILKARFDELIKTGRIRFVTFHQSFSYEDFVEGLRAQTNDNSQIEYRVEDGIFKQLCDQARTSATRQGQLEIAPNPRLWKISIDGTKNTSPSRNYCLDHNEARVGWGETGDLSKVELSAEEYQNLPETNAAFIKQLGSNDRNTLQTFSTEVAEGDILICIHSSSEIGAVGVVTGSYRYDEAPPSPMHNDYKHVLPVKWLYRGLKLSVLPLNENVKFTQKTVYALDRFSWGDLLAYLKQSGATPTHAMAESSASNEPHILIIDEINRGNVSRILGELITLIEPSKREGRSEALSVRLPYSKRPFSVPENVYLIGTMNTADRSLSGIDIALRRRFSFREMLPKPELLSSLNVSGVNIGQLLSTLNARIEVLLDRDHCLGHAYFLPLHDNPSLSEVGRIFRQAILPLLQEYFFEDWQRIQWVLNDHRKPKALRFVDEVDNSLEDLFGTRANVGGASTRWAVNETAFDNIESYRLIETVTESASS